MPRVTYQGPHDAVDLRGYGSVKRGQTVTVSAAVAKSLDAQADWKTVADQKPRKTAAKKAAATKKTPNQPDAGTGENSEE